MNWILNITSSTPVDRDPEDVAGSRFLIFMTTISAVNKPEHARS